MARKEQRERSVTPMRNKLRSNLPSVAPSSVFANNVADRSLSAGESVLHAAVAGVDELIQQQNV